MTNTCQTNSGGQNGDPNRRGTHKSKTLAWLSVTQVSARISATLPSLFHSTTPWRENAPKSKSPCFYWHNKIRVSFLLRLHRPRSLSFLSFSDSYSVSGTVTVTSDFWISSLISVQVRLLELMHAFVFAWVSDSDWMSDFQFRVLYLRFLFN